LTPPNHNNARCRVIGVDTARKSSRSAAINWIVSDDVDLVEATAELDVRKVPRPAKPRRFDTVEEMREWLEQGQP